MIEAIALLAALHGASVEPASVLTLSPVLVQNGSLFRSAHATSGGVGGGAGVQLEYGAHWITQLDLSFLLGFGTAGSARLAAGYQRSGWYAPAGLTTVGVIFGQRVEFLTGDGSTRAPHDWIVGLRGAALRFAGAAGTISLLEPGVGLGLRGGYAVELTVVQASLRF